MEVSSSGVVKLIDGVFVVFGVKVVLSGGTVVTLLNVSVGVTGLLNGVVFDIDVEFSV